MDREEALKIVKALIDDEEKRLRDIASDEDADPITLFGYTSKMVDAHCLVASNEVAQILLNYDFPIYEVLNLDAPQAMWDALAMEYGLREVCEVDI